MTLLCVGSFAWADEATFDIFASNFSGDNSTGTYSKDDFTFTLKKGSTNNRYADTNHLRIYANSQLEVKGDKGQKITSIVFTSQSSDVGDMTVDGTKYSWTSKAANATLTWTGDAESVTFVAAAQTRIKKAVITYTPGEADAVAMPTFVVEEMDEFTSRVEINCETEGASIYYTLDGTDPTDESTLYTEWIECYSGTTTVKAVAYKDGESSKVATTVVEIPYILDSFSALSDFPEDQDVKIVIKDTVLTVVYQNGANLYVKDQYGNYMLLYAYNQPSFSNGDTIARIDGTYTVYNGQSEIKDFTLGDVTTGGDAVNPIITGIDMIGVTTMNQYFAIENVAITGVSGKNGTMEDADGNTVALYNKFSVDGFADTEKNVTVTGFVAKNYDTVQFLPILIEEYVDPYSAPVFNPADGTEVAAGTMITITAGEDAEIYWRSDAFYMDEDEFELYAEGDVMIPFNASGSVTFEAYAKYGDTVTETVSATYKIGKGDVNAHFYDFATWEEITEYTMTYGDEIGFAFEANYMDEFEVTSSNEDVAIFNWEYWGFEIVGPGTTTLTITIPESYSYRAGSCTLELTVLDPNAGSATIDFVGDGESDLYGMTRLSGSTSAYNPVGTYVAELEDVNVDLTVSGNTRLWKDGLRMYKNSDIVVSIPGAKITSLSLTKGGSFSITVGEETTSSTSWKGEGVESVTINCTVTSSNAALAGFTIEYIKTPAPEGAHNFVAEEVEEGETTVLVVTGVHAESELYYRFTPAEEPEVTTYAVSHEGFTKSETFEAADDNTNTHRIAVEAAGTYELYTYHAASATKSEVTEIKVKATTGVISIEADNEGADVEYYNLQGIRVDNPANGLYIRREGNKTTKVVL